MCYKDGPKLPLLNFTTTCFEYGRYVIFYNERPQNVTYPPGYEAYTVYTDLCEVIVLGTVFFFKKATDFCFIFSNKNKINKAVFNKILVGSFYYRMLITCFKCIYL